MAKDLVNLNVNSIPVTSTMNCVVFIPHVVCRKNLNCCVVAVVGV